MSRDLEQEEKVDPRSITVFDMRANAFTDRPREEIKAQMMAAGRSEEKAEAELDRIEAALAEHGLSIGSTFQPEPTHAFRDPAPNREIKDKRCEECGRGQDDAIHGEAQAQPQAVSAPATAPSSGRKRGTSEPPANEV